MKKQFLNMYFAKNRHMPINTTFLENIIYDLNNNNVPYYWDILVFSDSLNMKDSTKLIKYYLKILDKGINCLESLKLKFFITSLIEKHNKRYSKYTMPYNKYYNPLF